MCQQPGILVFNAQGGRDDPPLGATACRAAFTPTSGDARRRLKRLTVIDTTAAVVHIHTAKGGYDRKRCRRWLCPGNDDGKRCVVHKAKARYGLRALMRGNALSEGLSPFASCQSDRALLERGYVREMKSMEEFTNPKCRLSAGDRRAVDSAKVDELAADLRRVVAILSTPFDGSA
ncbi:hypothetical protein NL676_030852 [Syzygium grande]|nr:hypothetical protein NL676_030852 [Syzygium grande]